MRIAPWGWQTIFWVTVVVAWSAWLLWPTPVFWPLLPVLLFLWGFTLAFFRNPRRQPQGDFRHLCAPADGVVTDVTLLEAAPFLEGPAVRVGIFLSVFDVHVNSAPVDGRVVWSDYRPGRFLDARHPDAGTANECAAIGIAVDEAVAPGVQVLVRQISGLIARRIVCPVVIGEEFRRGAVYGMIRFGSRTELWLPAAVPHTVLVVAGQRVRSGETAMIRLDGSAAVTPGSTTDE